ncbi:MAG: branched-chain amino acid aminotransferase [Paludibacteraceae bacterium]|nr:branched-chain amino acid aminotransferase [Paludibacteraceae bacterium]
MKQIDWSKLGFHYTETDYIVRCEYHDGKWGEPYPTADKTIQLHLSATCLQYGQEAFEGLKAFRGADGKVRIFRMEENAKRLARSAEGLYMAPVPEELFRRSVLMALEMNMDYLPPYETGATLYFRPLLIGTTPRLGVGPGRDFLFTIIPSPIGPYFKVGFHGTPFIVNRHVDRAAPLGTGQFKVGGNYAASFRATEAAHAQGLSCLFLDSVERKYIDECGAANFFGIKQGKYVTPKSTSILPSITNNSLMQLARDNGIEVEQRPILLEELAEITECGACGTAAVISPISRVIDPDNGRIYEFGDEPGEVSKLLYNALQDIQYGRAEDKHHWCAVIG